MTLNRNHLKIIATISLLIDHLGYILAQRGYPISLDLYELMRGIGRIAFPLYGFLFVEGLFYTRSRQKYSFRLLILAIISELPYDLVVFNEFSMESQNIVWMYFLGSLIFYNFQGIANTKDALGFFFLCLLYSVLTSILKIDYGFIGALMISLLLLARYTFKDGEKRRLVQALIIAVTNIYQARGLANLVFLAAVFVYLYDGQKIQTNKSLNLIFYIIFPLHLLVYHLIF